MAREWTVTAALAGHRGAGRADRRVRCRGRPVLGAPCTVVEFVDRPVVRTETISTAVTDDAGRRECVDELVRVLADLHDVDHAASVSASSAVPDGFVARQVKLWASAMESRQDPRTPPTSTACAERSRRAIPTDTRRRRSCTATIRIDNTILDRRRPGSVAAVVDWEMSTLGDPLTDVALMCVYRQPVFDRVLGCGRRMDERPLSRADGLAQRYAAVSGS